MPRPSSHRLASHPPRLHLAWRVAACAVALLATPVPSHAANIFEGVGTFVGQDLLIDTSVRSVGMGRASGAVSWGVNPNSSVNPALLGLTQGIVYENATLAFDFNSQAVRLGYGGVGLVAAGYPFSDWGGLDFGTLLVVPGVGEVSDRVRSWGIGASVSAIAATVAGMRGDETPAFTRYADLAFGYSHSSGEMEIGPAPVTQFHEEGENWGLLARGRAPFQIGHAEAAYSYSEQSDGGTRGTFGIPNERPHRHGTAARLALNVPSGWRERITGWLEPGLEPLVSLGGAWDREFISAGSGPTVDDRTHLGGELGLANLAFVRLGEGDSRHTWGYGIGVPLGRLGGFQYDESHEKSGEGFPEVQNHSWTVWMNPIEIMSALR